MAKRLEQETKKYTIRLTNGSPEELTKYHPDAGGYAVIVRALIDGHIRKQREKLNRKLSEQRGMTHDREVTSTDHIPGLDD